MQKSFFYWIVISIITTKFSHTHTHIYIYIYIWVILRYSRSTKNGAPFSHIHGGVHHECERREHHFTILRDYLRIFLYIYIYIIYSLRLLAGRLVLENVLKQWNVIRGLIWHQGPSFIAKGRIINRQIWELCCTIFRLIPLPIYLHFQQNNNIYKSQFLLLKVGIFSLHVHLFTP